MASFVRELRIAEGQTLTADFRLVAVKKSLIDTGIDPAWLVDTDADGVPNLQERAFGWDHKLADSDDDGLPDGLVAWVGADAKVGAQRTELAPEFLWPNLGESFPLDETLTVELLFAPSPGAIGYHLRVFTKDAKQDIEETFDVAAGNLLLGEACALRWTPPVDWGAGKYELRLRGYFGSPEEWVGEEAATTLEFHEIEELQPLVLSDDRELSGLKG